MKEFTFNYFAAKNSVAFDDFIVKIKIGPFRKYEFAFPNIQNFYVFDNNQYRSIFITYTDDTGKNKKVQVFSTPAEMGFNQLAAELNAKIPQKSLNHLSEKEAFKVMKTANPKKWAPVVAFLFMLVVTSAFVYPGLRHYFDFGFADATVAEIGEGKDVGTRNIHITGQTLDQPLVETSSSSQGTKPTSKTTYIPLVSEDYVDGDPVKVILKFDGLSDFEYQEELHKTDFTGVVRNIAWEGIGNDQVDFFKQHFQMNFPSAPVLVEITNTEHNDFYALAVLVGMAVVIGIIVLITALKRG
jgi:hypothetical protein